MAMSRTAFTVHAIPGIVSTLPELKVASDRTIAALASFASVLADNPILLARFAVCEAMASSCDDDADAFQQSMAGMLQAGNVYTAADVGSIISELQPDAADDEPREVDLQEGEDDHFYKINEDHGI